VEEAVDGDDLVGRAARFAEDAGPAPVAPETSEPSPAIAGSQSGKIPARSRTSTKSQPALSPLERMTLLERLQADFRTMSLTTGAHPMKFIRPQLPGITAAADLAKTPRGARVRVAGSVITRQRPGTAKGFCFITLEDETGHANAIVRPALFEQNRLVINLEPALIITGRVQNDENVIHLQAERIEKLPSSGLPEQASHDFR
jgi:error-prone DNA polymerase